MGTRDTIACLLTVALLAAAPVYAQGKSGKGGGKGGGGDDSDGGGGDTPPDACQDRAAAFVYRSEHKNIGEDIMLASSEGCSTTLLSSRPNLTVRNLAYHLNTERSEGIVMWAERDPTLVDYSHDIVAVQFTVSNGEVIVGQRQQVSVPNSSDSSTYLQLPGDVRLGDNGSVYATLLHRSWIVEGKSANFELRLLQWTQTSFPSGAPEVSSAIPSPTAESLCLYFGCAAGANGDLSLRLEPPVFGSWSDEGLRSLFGNFGVNVGGEALGGVLYWPTGGNEPSVMAYGSNSAGAESAPRVAATHPSSPESEILLRHHITEKNGGDYYGSLVNVGCAWEMRGADAWQQCLGNDGRQVVEARFGATWLEPGIIVHSQAARKSTDIYRYDIANSSSTRIITGGWFPVATH